MLERSVCFKCNMKYYGADRTDRNIVKCYPALSDYEIQQCEDTFNREWEDGKVWCFGLANNASEEEQNEILGVGEVNHVFLNPKTDFANKFCDYLLEQPVKSEIAR